MSVVEADVAIVGAGVAGALLADRLAASGVRVAILEAGPRIDRGAAWETYLNALIKVPESPYPLTPEADHPIAHDNDHWLRQSGPDKFKSTYIKVVGGTTWHWLGTCVRYIPSDFRMRSLFGRAVDWPFDYEHLEPFYLEAERELGVAGDSSDDLGAPRSGPFPMPPIPQSYCDRVFADALAGSQWQVKATPQARNSMDWEDRPACCGSGSCIPICPVQAKYDAMVHLERAEANGAAIHEQCTATVVETDDERLVSGVRFRRSDGSDGVARARIYVVAAHGIETPRLLLNSRPAGTDVSVANGSDQVGRNLMDHPIQLSWALAGVPVFPYRGPLSTSGIENHRDGAIRSERSSLRIEIANDGWTWPTGGATTLADALARQGLRGLELRREIVDQASRHLRLASLTEQLPEPGNRVSLDGNERDVYGVPLPRIQYRVGQYSLDGLEAARAAHDEIFAKLDAAAVTHSDVFQGAGHIIGTCRMGDDPRSSVVDQNLRSHEHPNLFLLGSSVFPTSSTANPTLTIAALSLRAAPTVARSLAEFTTPT